MGNIYQKSWVVTYRWKYEGDDEILRAMALSDEEELKTYCNIYKIKPQRQLKDKRPTTMSEWDLLPAKRELFGLARKGWFKVLLINNMYALAKNHKEFYDQAKQLQQYGVSIICVDEKLDVHPLRNGIAWYFQESLASGMLD